jgi:RNA recognition motif-containing protein
MSEPDYKKQVSVLEKQLAEKDKIIKDPSKRGYYALNKILYQQITYLENFDLKVQIEADPKQDKIYERVTKIWEGLKTMILDCRALKSELKIPNDEEEKEIKKIYRLTPESISDVLGNTAGQQS